MRSASGGRLCVARRKWNPPLNIEPDTQYIERGPDGYREGIRFTLCAEDIEMIRQGYKCVDCLELFDSAFPVECHLCGFPVKDAQPEAFAELFAGDRHVGSRVNADEELERLARQKHERELREGLRSKGIVIPRNVKL